MRKILRLRLIVAAAIALAAAPIPGIGELGSRSQGGLAGSGAATMQPVNLPARPAFVAQVPGKRGAEAWAIGLSVAPMPEWDLEAPGGQVVFLRYTKADGWMLTGPPRSSSGAVVHRSLTALALTRAGEGWAVGDGGTILHHRPGGGWVETAQSRSLTTRDLAALTLGEDASGVWGYAVGEGGVVLRLSGSTWSVDRQGADALPDFVGVAAVSRERAFAIGGANASRTLDVQQRAAAGWTPMPTGKPMFDGPSMPAKTEGAIVNTAAIGAAAAAAGNTVWFGGRIQPLDPAKPFGDDLVGVDSRPFVLRLDVEQGTFTSYCPRYHSLGDFGGSTVNDVCQEPFPLSGFEVTSLAAFEQDGRREVFAGGLGFFHFTGERWIREPNVDGYLISIAMATPLEGWVASSGSAFGAGGAAQSTTITLGHWTTTPARPRMARWPQFNREVLESIALAPDGSGRAIAAGQDGATVHYAPEEGWDIITRGTDRAYHAVAWPEITRGWGVGERGLIRSYDPILHDWLDHPRAGVLTRASLYGLAFAGPNRGYAVGTNGTILRYDGTDWSLDPQSGSVTEATLYSLAHDAGRFVAVGAEGTILEHAGDRWRVAQSPAAAGRDLFAAALLPDGTAFAGGQRGTLLRRRPGGRFEQFPASLDSTIVALAAGRAGDGTVNLFASVSPEADKYNGDRLETANGWLMHGTERGWRDIEFAHYRTVYATTDTARPHDATYAIALEDGGTAGWAVGGTPSLAPDQDLHLNAVGSSSVYRIDLIGDPRPPELPSSPELPEDGFTFAYFGETACGQGLCGLATGSGPRADLVPLRIQSEVNRLAAQPGGPKFVMFGGGMRRVPLPEELEQFKGFLDGFGVPVFGALGNRDLLQSPERQAADGLPPVIPPAVQATMDANRRDLVASNRFFLESFSDRPAPWGYGSLPDGIRAVHPATTIEPDPTQARTHYAFDYRPAGTDRALARIVVLDSSAKRLNEPTTQNPQGQDQNAFLNEVVATARAARIPVFVVMNVPPEDPTSQTPVFVWSPEQAGAFYANTAGKGISAFLTSYLRMNARYDVPLGGVPGAVPFYIFGGGGSPLDGTRVAEDGFYHSWQLVTVRDRPADLVTNVSPHTVRSYPALESIAIRAVRGRAAKAGDILEFEGLGRIVEGGGPTDPEQARGSYIRFGALERCSPRSFGAGACFGFNVVRPTYRFYTEDPSIARFVEIDAGTRLPLLRDGALVPDDQSGFLCTLKAGTTYVNIVSGFHRTRTKITVSGGDGPCIDVPAPDLPAPVVLPRREVPPAPLPETKPKGAFRPLPPDSLAVVLAPPPAPVVAPAPPAAPGVGKKEETEYEYEYERQSYDFRAVRRQRGPEPWTLPAAAALVTIMATTAAAVHAKRRKEVPGWIVQRR